MGKLPLTLIAALLGAIIGLSMTFVFKILPEKWLQDYDFNPNSPNYRPSKRMKIFPHGIFAALFGALSYASAAYFSYEYLFVPVKPFHIISIALTIPVVIIVMMSDRLNRIIPDQCSLFILLLGVLALFGDYFEHSIWFNPAAPWYYSVFNRIIAMVIGFGVLWLIGFIAESFMGKESMGQGDMKLLGACGLLIGNHGLIVLIYVASISALFFAIPLLIKKRIRIAKEEEEIRNSKDPVAARRALNKKKAQIHFADDPDYIAFGPFLSLGAAVFLVLEPICFKLLFDFILATGWYF